MEHLNKTQLDDPKYVVGRGGKQTLKNSGHFFARIAGCKLLFSRSEERVRCHFIKFESLLLYYIITIILTFQVNLNCLEKNNHVCIFMEKTIIRVKFLISLEI